MAESNVVFFHQEELSQVRKGLQQRTDYLLQGPDGIGKTTFLKDLPWYWQNKGTDRRLAFWFVSFTLEEIRQEAELRDAQADNLPAPVPTGTIATFQEQVLEELKEAAADASRLTIFLFDDIDKAMSKDNLQFVVDLFKALATLKDRSTPRYIMTSRESPWTIFEHTYERGLLPQEWPDVVNLSLGLAPESEAHEFIVQAGGNEELTQALPWLKKHVASIRDLAGCFPWFLDLAVREAHDKLHNCPELEMSEFEQHFGHRVESKFQRIWRLSEPEERELLCKIAYGREPSAGPEYLLLKDSLFPKALVTSGNELFSEAFRQFVANTNEYMEYAQAQMKKSKPFWQDPEKIRHIVLALLIFFPVVLLLVFPSIKNPVFILWSALVFVLIFSMLMGLYFASEH